ncbi:MAG: hypothetical protein CL609_11975 [Anaerolineaceae bacterium]|nr:hypothetical protein [Anaerolineaceae bacterium]
MLGEENILFMLVFVVGGVIFGALIMYLIMDVRQNQRNASEHRHTQPLSAPNASEKEEPVTQNQNESQIPETKNSPPELERKKLVGFWRDIKSGHLLVQMEDQWFENTKQMDEGLRLRYDRTLREAAQWLDMVLSQPGVEKRVETPNAAASNGQITGLDEPPKRKMTIVEQVDEILQDLLKESPLKEQNIRLSEIYNKGVVVWVGTQYFEGIDAVPHEDVKQIIKTAVKKWEVKNSSR